MIWIDYGIIGLVSLCAINGMIRGFVREAIALINWTLAFWVGLTFSQGLSIHFRSMIANVPVRMAMSFVLLFLLTLILARLLGFILRQLVASTGLSGSERLAGLICGSGRGLLLVTMFVMLAGLSGLPRNSWWRESNLIPPFQSVASWLKRQIPSGVAGIIDYRH
ncbi:MAG: CvpA family protein [Methylococcales bacterium]